jgi:thiamine pyrophosphokinase
MTTPYNCVIVANGEFPHTPLPLEYLHHASTIIACDGAVNSLEAHQITPNAIVGDLDSISPNSYSQYTDRIHIVENQEINDLTKAVHYAHSLGFKNILILAATGLREDHTIGNVSLLIEYAQIFEHVEMLSDFGLFTPLLQTTTLSSIKGQQISIFSLNDNSEITTEGLRWPINHRKLTSWWQGSLNEATGSNFTITLSPSSQVIIYRSNEIKHHQ